VNVGQCRDYYVACVSLMPLPARLILRLLPFVRSDAVMAAFLRACALLADPHTSLLTRMTRSINPPPDLPVDNTHKLSIDTFARLACIQDHSITQRFTIVATMSSISAPTDATAVASQPGGTRHLVSSIVTNLKEKARPSDTELSRWKRTFEAFAHQDESGEEK
jgi:hypothetical protein